MAAIAVERPASREGLLADLERICPGAVAHDVSLAAISRWRIGGAADILVRPSQRQQVVALRQYFHRFGIKHVAIGSTSNLLFADEGLRVPCIQIDGRLSRVTIEDDLVEAEAGTWVPGLARRIMQAGLAGAEHICGIPGTLGGLICMNGGTQRKGIGSALYEVRSVDSAGNTRVRNQIECRFNYRQSIFQEADEVILVGRMRFPYAIDNSVVRQRMIRILTERRQKFPQKLPNCGSVFKSNPAMYEDIGPPGAAIERLGFKGRRLGGAVVSPAHANFIVNTGGASARDVLGLISLIVQAVHVSTGYRMEPEVRYVTPEGEILPAGSNLAGVTA